MNAVRSTLRPIRFELVAVALLAGVAIVIAGGSVARLLLFGIPKSCMTFELSGAADCVRYARAIAEYEEFLEASRSPALAAAIGLPVVAALLAGVALVGKEIDQRTTVLAWSMAPSRARWLLLRVAPMLVALGVFSLVAGGLVDLLFGLSGPGIDQAHDFVGLGLRGVPILGIGVLVFGVSLLVGAVLGRVLPAVLLSGALIATALFATANVNERLLFADSVIADSYDPGDLPIDSLIRTPEGEIIGWAGAYDRYGPLFDQGGPEAAGFTQVWRIVRGGLYP